MAAFREALEAADAEFYGDALWKDVVVAREDVDFEEAGGLRTLPPGTPITVLVLGAAEGRWKGELADGARGYFPRRQVRELDCASSEDEEEYQPEITTGIGEDAARYAW